MEDSFIHFLAIVDSLHDFYDLDNNNNFFCFTKLFYFLNRNEIFKCSTNKISKIVFDKDKYKIFEVNKSTIKVNSDLYRNNLFEKIINNVKKNSKSILIINNQIITNFNKLFNFSLDNSCVKNNVLFKNLLSDDKKIQLRLQIYHLIKNKTINNELVNFLIKYLNLDILNEIIIKTIKQKILTNLQNTEFKNEVYPVTYFDDTNVGLNKKYFMFNILNADKQYIDGALTTGIEKYLANNANEKGNNNIILSNESTTLGISVSEHDIIELLGFKWYLKNKQVVCDYKNIQLKLISNTVGRNSKDDNNNGIYQLTCKLMDIYEKIYDKLKKNSVEQLQFEYKLKIFDLQSKIIKTFKKLGQVIGEINKRNFDLFDDKIFDILQKERNYVKRDYRTIQNKKKEIKNLIENYNNILLFINKVIRFKKPNKAILIINLYIENINEQINFLQKLGLSVDKIHKISLTPHEIGLLEYILGNNLNGHIDITNENVIQLVFFDNIQQVKKKINDIIFIDDLHIQFYNLYKHFKDDVDLGLGCLVFMLFGAKRFGDWIQMYLSKKHWFILQTNDFYCKVYGYLIGAPVIFDDIIYNYLPPDDLKITGDFNAITVDSIKNLQKYTGEKTLIYKSLRNIKTDEVSRMYFKKYLKYKKKYLTLKQKGGQLDFTDVSMNIYLLFITEKLIASDPADLLGGGEKRKITETPQPRSRARPSYLADYIENLTPAVLEYLSPISRQNMELDIQIDTCVQNKLNAMAEPADPDYVQYENFGKLLECWFGDNNACPCCGANTLRRYAKDSMPAIDLVCINPTHTIDQGVRFFQVKTSNGSAFRSKPYFNLDPTQANLDANTIHVGSRTYGEPIHSISPHDDTLDKKILIGYVCIRYRESESNLHVLPTESFFILPKYTNSLQIARANLTYDSAPVQIDTWYYQYVEPNGTHQRIQFNLNTNSIVKFSDSGIRHVTISKAYVIKTTQMPNPLSNWLRT